MYSCHSTLMIVTINLQRLQTQAVQLPQPLEIVETKCSKSLDGWLSLENRRFMHKWTMIYKCRNGLAPPYLINSFNANTFNHSYSTRNSSKLRIPIARTEYYYRNILISGWNAWNNLSDYIGKSVSLNSFKLNMFKYLLA